jgi:hypothetical protein
MADRSLTRTRLSHSRCNSQLAGRSCGPSPLSRAGAIEAAARCSLRAVSDEFFGRPRPIRDPGPPPPSPPWTGPPYGVLPGAAPLELVIAANARAAVYVGRCSAYETGFELDVRVLVARETGELDPSLNGPYHRGRGDNYDEMLRFGVQFSDGSKATNVGGRGYAGEEPEGPVLWGMGGGGGGGRWRQDFWVWPLPPAGPLVFVCEWPAAGIPLTRAEVDAQLLLDASTRARALFPDQASSRRSAAPPPVSPRR